VPRERPAPASRWRRPSAAPAAATVAPSLPPGHTRREIEGVFLIRNGLATFVPVQVGIAGERHFEVLEGLNEGDQVITGPFDSVRNMFDGDQVRVQAPGTRR